MNRWLYVLWGIVQIGVLVATYPGWHLGIGTGEFISLGVHYDHGIAVMLNFTEDRMMELPNKKLRLHIADPVTIHVTCDCFGKTCNNTVQDDGQPRTEYSRAGGCEIEHRDGWTDIWMENDAAANDVFHELCHWDGSIPRQTCEEKWPWRGNSR